MNWFVWRQHRKQFLSFGVLLALFAALLIPTGIHYWHTYQQALTNCAQHPALYKCDDLTNTLFSSQADGFIRIAEVLGTFGLPLLVGLFVGAPLVAREYEEGTNKLAWTQSVSRRKWLTTKVVWVLGFALLYGITLTILATWWSRTLNTVAHNRFVQGHFETQGLMPVAYSVFFTALGFAVGAWFRKTILAFAITFGVFVLCMASFANWVRPHYMTPVTVTAAMGPNSLDGKIPTDAWILQRNIVDKNGKVLNGDLFREAPPQCQKILQQAEVQGNGHGGIRVKAVPNPNGGDPIDDCLNKAGFHQIAKYQPSYRYWDFQRIEASIYLGMTALAVAAKYWLVLKRDA
ncbi:MAG TPA: ABC transporter permease subunit [Verrucomicrobiae bacterium]|nr:ABC transporter permease subunit [Verrucomicrobiae bacterium]